MKIGVDWLKFCKTEEDRQEIRNLVENSPKVLEILKQILLYRKASFPLPREEDYANPNWAHKEAHRRGRIEELEYVLKLLTPIDRG